MYVLYCSDGAAERHAARIANTTRVLAEGEAIHYERGALTTAIASLPSYPVVMLCGPGEYGPDPALLGKFLHPRQAIYVLGSDLGPSTLEPIDGALLVRIETAGVGSLHSEVALGIVLWHRRIQRAWGGSNPERLGSQQNQTLVLERQL